MPATDHEARLLIEQLQATLYGGVGGVTAAKVGGSFFASNPASNIQYGTETIAYAASITPDAGNGKPVKKVGILTGNLTINTPLNPADGAILIFLFQEDGTGNRTVTLPAAIHSGWSMWYEPNNISGLAIVYDGTLGYWRDLPGGIATDQLGSAIVAGTLQVGDPAGTYGVMQLHTVAGFHGRQLEIISVSTDNLGSAGLNIVPGSAISPTASTSQLLLYNQVGTNYERAGFTWSNRAVTLDVTYNGTGQANPFIIAMGGSVSNSITSRTAFEAYGDGSVDLIGTSTYLAQTKNWYVTGLRITDPENRGDPRLSFDTRTGTPASNTADSAGIRFGRGGSLKWTVGLNVNGGNADGLDFLAASGSGPLSLIGGSSSGNVTLALQNSDASGHTWKLGEIFAAGSLSFRDTVQSGAPEVIRLIGSTQFLAVNAAGGFDTIAAGTLRLGTTTATAVQVGRTGQSVGLYGTTPVAKAAAITTPTAPSAAYVQAEAQSMKTAVDAIRVALTNIGITA